MRIGFDAYFAFHYKTGVAHYGRNVISSLARFYPEAELVLFTDRRTDLYTPSFENVRVVELEYEVPYHRWLTDSGLLRAIENANLDIFHGLDHGLPALTGMKTVVTVHDLFFETHAALYSDTDVAYYKRVTPQACADADAIVAISRFTAAELQSRYEVPPARISVCYQTCNPLFFESVPGTRKQELRQQFNLPPRFWLYVGSVIERKNLLNICRAMNLVKEQSGIPLMVIGEGGDYLELVKDYMAQHELENQIRFLSYTPEAIGSVSFQQARDVPAFHQMALALLYPSQLEGFGIPIVEAFASGLPVITSRTTSLPEIGGDAAMYVDHRDPADIARCLLQLENDVAMREEMIAKGKELVRNFTAQTMADAVMNVYRRLL